MNDHPFSPESQESATEIKTESPVTDEPQVVPAAEEIPVAAEQAPVQAEPTVEEKAPVEEAPAVEEKAPVGEAPVAPAQPKENPFYAPKADLFGAPKQQPPAQPTAPRPPVAPRPDIYPSGNPNYPQNRPDPRVNQPNPYARPNPQQPPYGAPRYTPPIMPTPSASKPTPKYGYFNPESTRREPKKKKSVWNLLIIGLCIALVSSVVTGVVVGFVIDKKNQLKAAETTEAVAQAEPTEPTDTQQSATTRPQSVITPPSDLSELYDNAVPTIVGIYNEFTTTDYFYQTTGSATGTGFIISSDGEILTNYHVVEGANTLTVTLYDGTEYEATVLGYEAESDVALIKIDAENLPVAPLGDSDALKVGEMITAIGNPLGELTYTMTVGYVSAKGRAIYTDDMPINMLQIDAAINPGNSGGPMFNMAGEVVGITTAKYTSTQDGSTTVEGIGFAIPINDALSIVNDLREHGSVQNRAYIGVVVTNSSVGGDIPAGAMVQSVEKRSAGDKAGLRPSDIITAVDDAKVEGIDTLYQALRPYRGGDTAELTVFRGGDIITLTITFDSAPNE